MQAKLTQFKNWAYNHSNQSDPKYASLSHPLLITSKSTLIFIFTSLIIRYIFFPIPPHNEDLQNIAFATGIFLELYLIFMIGTRYLEGGAHALY